MDYEWFKPRNKYPEEDLERIIIIDVEHVNKLDLDNKFNKEYEVKYWKKFWIGYHNLFPDYNAEVIRWRYKNANEN